MNPVNKISLPITCTMLESVHSEKLSLKDFPSELILRILSTLNMAEVSHLRLVAWQWYYCADLAEKSIMDSDRSLIKGADTWDKYFGNVGKEPVRQQVMYELLKKGYRIVDGKIVNIFRAVLIPKTVNGKPYTPNLMGELVKTPKEGNPTKYVQIDSDIIGGQVIEEEDSYFAVFLTDLSERDKWIDCTDRRKGIEKRSREGSLFQLPKPLDAITLNFMVYVSEGCWVSNLARKGYDRGYDIETICKAFIDKDNVERLFYVSNSSAGLSVYWEVEFSNSYFGLSAEHKFLSNM
ncbi:MAG: F-box protein [Parachlamydiaceae bacterium]|nr:F-box protein [Parachlamydiaceae bacterium]